jgi:hypothetical protein
MPTPTVDPRWVSVATRCRSLRVSLDRLDDALDLLDAGGRRAEAVTHAVMLRDQLDQLEALVETWTAGR